ncbi:hypothetical protein DL96DRAFT_1572703 [Flagelloscypha sp. PMI_526]|nr:hypothetical protein DL96DRAFT_1572703 [Flagelloscypha sp. PMI_526]
MCACLLPSCHHLGISHSSILCQDRTFLLLLSRPQVLCFLVLFSFSLPSGFSTYKEVLSRLSFHPIWPIVTISKAVLAVQLLLLLWVSHTASVNFVNSCVLSIFLSCASIISSTHYRYPDVYASHSHPECIHDHFATSVLFPLMTIISQNELN